MRKINQNVGKYNKEYINWEIINLINLNGFVYLDSLVTGINDNQKKK